MTSTSLEKIKQDQYLVYVARKKEITKILEENGFKYKERDDVDIWYWFTITVDGTTKTELYVSFEDGYEIVSLNLSNFQVKIDMNMKPQNILYELLEACSWLPHAWLYEGQYKTYYANAIQQLETGVASYKAYMRNVKLDTLVNE